VDEDPDYMAKLFTVMDQVLLSQWVDAGIEGRARAARGSACARRSSGAFCAKPTRATARVGADA